MLYGFGTEVINRVLLPTAAAVITYEVRKALMQRDARPTRRISADGPRVLMGRGESPGPVSIPIGARVTMRSETAPPETVLSEAESQRQQSVAKVVCKFVQSYESVAPPDAEKSMALLGQLRADLAECAEGEKGGIVRPYLKILDGVSKETAPSIAGELYGGLRGAPRPV